MVDKFLFDRDAAAEALSTSTRRIDDLRRAGVLIAVQDGREYKYTATELQRYVESLSVAEPRRAS